MANEYRVEFLPVKGCYAVVFYAGLSSLFDVVKDGFASRDQANDYLKTIKQ